MSENKTGKYFKYAIGEIVLVVIGILIALSINNWNEDRKNNKIEEVFLKDVNQEFKSNLAQLNIQIGYHQIQFDACSQIQAKFPITPDDWDSVKFEIQGLVRSSSFDPHHSSIESLINSSSIDLIQNQKLKKELLSWIPLVKDWKEEELKLNQSVDEMASWMIKNVDSHDKMKIMNPSQLYELQNLIIQRCFWQDYIKNGSSLDNETEAMINTMKTIIEMTEPYAK